MSNEKIIRDVPGASIEIRGDGQFTDDEGKNVQYKRMVTLTGGKATKSGAYQITPARFMAMLEACSKDKDVYARLKELAAA